MRCPICSTVLCKNNTTLKEKTCDKCFTILDSQRMYPKIKQTKKNGKYRNTYESMLKKAVKKSNGCLLMPPTGADGYARMFLGGVQQLAHRIAYEYSTGLPIPKGMLIFHNCESVNCINPDHLFMGTRQEMSNIMIKQGKAKHTGSKSKVSKLTEEDVIQIRKYLKQGITHRKIAKSFKVVKATITHINRGHTWKHVTS